MLCVSDTTLLPIEEHNKNDEDDESLLASPTTQQNTEGEELDMSDCKTVKQLYDQLQRIPPPVWPAGT